MWLPIPCGRLNRLSAFRSFLTGLPSVEKQIKKMMGSQSPFGFPVISDNPRSK